MYPLPKAVAVAAIFIVIGSVAVAAAIVLVAEVTQSLLNLI